MDISKWSIGENGQVQHLANKFEKQLLETSRFTIDKNTMAKLLQAQQYYYPGMKGPTGNFTPY